ncbi:hypothetical protein GJ496_003607 [Pomphorhynchus laevis]|nr:hypothetical protein GJ496_003607 [Pomphorhynchus laevis]
MLTTTICKAAVNMEFCTSQLNHNRTLIEQFCENINQTANLVGKCCIESDDRLIGVVVRSRNELSNIKEIAFIGKGNLSEIEFLELLSDGDDLTMDLFIGFVNLRFLIIPISSECPSRKHENGSSTSTVAWSNQTKQNNVTTCFGQINPCVDINHNSTKHCRYYGYEMQCIHTGPGMYSCLCKDSYFGYKCLKTSQFPVVVFTATSLILSIAIIIILVILACRIKPPPPPPLDSRNHYEAPFDTSNITDTVSEQ